MTAMILAGGKSSRMGQDKALLKFGAKTLLENLTALLEPLFKEILVIVNDRVKCQRLKLGRAKVYEDLLKERGPLAAIYTGLQYSASPASCILTCDMPFIDERFISELVRFWEEGCDAICIEEPEGECQPFPGIYARSSRHLIRSLLNRGRDSMKGFLEVASLKPLVLQKKKIQVLTNMNTIEDYYRVLREKEKYFEETER
jgi:molybdopterin-guanine dinucleotide biosynthesis protein A